MDDASSAQLARHRAGPDDDGHSRVGSARARASGDNVIVFKLEGLVVDPEKVNVWRGAT